MIGAVVLAAGESTRMGTQKLFLPYAGSTIIEHITDQVLESGAGTCLIVTGHEPDRVMHRLRGRTVVFAHNTNYREGMLTSVRAGLTAAAADGSWQAALIVLGDQPSITAATIDRLLEEHIKNPDRVLVPVFEGRRGHPILVPMRFHTEVMNRFDDTGLRGLLRAHPEAVTGVSIDTPAILEDIDYPEDYQRALRALASDERRSERDLKALE